MKCFKCGISEKKAFLFEMISQKGVVKICRKCSFKENSPIIHKINNFNLKNPEVKYPKIKKFPIKITKINNSKNKEYDKNLKKIINKNIVEDTFYSKKIENLIDNFHWIIMRARRSQKLTQKQFAEKIKESEILIKLAEKGIISKGKEDLIKKIENSLGITIFKKKNYENYFEQEKQEIKKEIIQKDKMKFNEIATKMLTISDLNELKEKKENKIFEKDESIKNKKNLTDKEIEDIIFKK
jgi:ribosome-binding protein aMBF1 (putative translation factor)